MGEKEPTPGKPSTQQRMKAGLETPGGMLATGASRGSDEGDSEDAARLSTNVPKQTQGASFGGLNRAGLASPAKVPEQQSGRKGADREGTNG